MFDYHAHLLLKLDEFTGEQIGVYLQNRNINNIPAWLPSRPLLLGHLAARAIFQADVKAETAHMSRAESWDWLLDVVSHREAGIVEAGLSGEAVREIIERLASQARINASGIGPLSQREIRDTFVGLRGQEPSDSEQAILQRLPGLARDPDFEEGTRSFIDVDFASVAQARDVSNLAADPFDGVDDRAAKWRMSLPAVGMEVAAYQVSRVIQGSGQLKNAFKHASRKDLYVVLADLVRISIEQGYPVEESVVVDGVEVPNLSLPDEMVNCRSVSFSNCLFDELEFGDLVDENMMPRFESCHIQSVLGRFGESDLPAGVFSNCNFEDFPDSPGTKAAILGSDLPIGVRVTLTILRKLYMQSGRGRLESALGRGMAPNERTRVAACLALLQRERMVSSTRIKSRTIWLPNRSSQARALQFIEAPRGSGDPLYSTVSDL